jgi:hypothetical protein
MYIYFGKIKNTLKVSKYDETEGGGRSGGWSFEKWRNITKSKVREEYPT